MTWFWESVLKLINNTKTIHPSAVAGTLDAPSSKSLTQRALVAGLQSWGISSIFNPAYCNDTFAALLATRRLGAEVVEYRDHIKVAGNLSTHLGRINCSESGLAMRMFAPIAAKYSHRITFTGSGSLLKRPVNMIEEALTQLGVEVKTNNGFPPFSVKGPIRGGKVVIDGSVSSQLLTGLLLTLPVLEEDSEITVKNLKSKPYIAMTLELLEAFGVKVENHNFETFTIPGRQEFQPIEYVVEGDWSNSAFLMVAAAISGEIKLLGLRTESQQADKAIIEAMSRAGAVPVIESGELSVSKSELHAFDFDATHCPDLFPPLAALAAYCRGTSRITGTSRLIHKESNRARSILKVLKRLGIHAHIEGDVMHIKGGRVRGGSIFPHNDHRIAMMACILALGAKKPVRIFHSDCVEKSYPLFYRTMERIGVKMSYRPPPPEPELKIRY